VLYDAFISHASEDKEDIVRLLAEARPNADCVSAFTIPDHGFRFNECPKQKTNRGLRTEASMPVRNQTAAASFRTYSLRHLIRLSHRPKYGPSMSKIKDLHRSTPFHAKPARYGCIG
jgi:hypothetical protein